MPKLELSRSQWAALRCFICDTNVVNTWIFCRLVIPLKLGLALLIWNTNPHVFWSFTEVLTKYLYLLPFWIIQWRHIQTDTLVINCKGFVEAEYPVMELGGIRTSRECKVWQLGFARIRTINDMDSDLLLQDKWRKLNLHQKVSMYLFGLIKFLKIDVYINLRCVYTARHRDRDREVKVFLFCSETETGADSQWILYTFYWCLHRPQSRC